MPPTTKITKDNLRIYPSERLTDTPDGGGLMVGTPLTGAKNELFSPVSNMDRINGAFNIRKIYPAVLRPDDEPVWGANFIIAMPPQTPNWSFLAFKSVSDAENREQIAARIAAFNIKTIPSRMVLMARQSVGSRVIQAYQDIELPLPKVGEVFCLDQEKTGFEVAEQYVRFQSITDEVRTFVDDNDKSFKKRVLTIETREKIKHSFIGMDYPVIGKANPACVIRETHAADSAAYFGVKRATANALKDTNQVQVESLFEKIIPTATNPINLADQRIGDKITGLVDATRAGDAGVITVTTSAHFGGGQSLFVGTAIVPGSLSITVGGTTLTESNGELFDAGESIANIDYVSGEIASHADAPNYYGNKTIKYRLAGTHIGVADTALIPVTIANRRKVYAITLTPAAALGSLSVSYRAQNKWYTIRDDGSGTLRGLSDEYGSGSLDPITGTLTLTLEILADPDTAILLSWMGKSSFGKPLEVRDKPYIHLNYDQQRAFRRGVTLSYDLDNGSGAQTLSVDVSSSNGHLFTASDDHVDVRMTWSGLNVYPKKLPGTNATYRVAYQTYPFPESTGVTLGAPDAQGYTAFDVGVTGIEPQSLVLDVVLQTDTEGVVDRVKEVRFSDDGNGNLLNKNGAIMGDFDPITGKGKVKLAAPLTVLVWQAERAQLSSSDAFAYLYQNKSYQAVDYVYAGGRARASFAKKGTSVDQARDFTHQSMTLVIEKNSEEPLIRDCTAFRLGAKVYVTQNGEVVTDIEPATGKGRVVGSVDKDAGKLIFNEWQAGIDNNPQIIAALSKPKASLVSQVAFRAPVNQLYPQGLQITGKDANGAPFDATVDADGKINDTLVGGTVDIETGVVNLVFGRLVDASAFEDAPWYNADDVVNGKIRKPEAIFAGDLRYNASGFSYVPMDSTHLGIESARLPSDGLVPIFRPGDSVVIASRWQQELGTAFSAGQVIQLNQTGLTVMCLLDSSNKHVEATRYQSDLDAGTITFTEAIDPDVYTLPLVAYYAYEEEHKVIETDLNGTLYTEFALGRTFDKLNCTVSSALWLGDMQVRATAPFSQESWDNVWADERRTGEILAKLDTRSHPIKLTDDGTMTERYLIRFTGDTQFELYGETLGLIGKYDKLEDLAPANPATGKPLFFLKKEAFGDSSAIAWRPGYCIRFNTYSTTAPVVLVRVVQPSNDKQINDDGYAVLFRADTVPA